MFQARLSLCSKQDIPCQEQPKNHEDSSDFNDLFDEFDRNGPILFFRNFRADKKMFASLKKFRSTENKIALLSSAILLFFNAGPSFNTGFFAMKILMSVPPTVQILT